MLLVLWEEMQIAARVAEGKDWVLSSKIRCQPCSVDINMLLRVCDVHNVPIATNEATAQLLLKSL
jgi:methylglyoxal synthase